MLARVALTLASVALLLAGNGLLGAALPGRWLKEGIDAETIAALGSANYFGVLLGAVFGIALVSRLGSGRAASLFALLFAGSTLATAAGFVVIGAGAAITAALIALPRSLFNASGEPAPHNHGAITTPSPPLLCRGRVRAFHPPPRSRPCLRPAPSPFVRPRGKTSW